MSERRDDKHKGLRIGPRQGDVVPSRPRQARDEEFDEGPSQEDIERFGDQTRTCPECRKEVFDDSAVCYHCGHAFENTTAGSGKGKVWIIAVATLIVIGFLIGALRFVL